LVLRSRTQLVHAKNLAHRALLYIREAGPRYPMMGIVLPVLVLALVAAAFILPMESCISRSVRQSPLLRSVGTPTPAPRGSARRATPPVSPWQSRPPTATASLSHVPPMMATPHQLAAATIPGPLRLPCSPRQPHSPQGTPHVSNASHLPWSACCRLTTAAIPHLCAELVVPDETECNLLVPELLVTSTFTISINDAADVPVFRASLSFPSSRHLKPGPSSDTRRLTLWSAIDGLAFASCRDAEPVADKRPALAIFHHSEVPFGILQPNSSLGDGCYSILAHIGREIFLYRAAEGVGMRAEDESGRLLAIVIGVAPRSIRIGPQVDAGLMTLALLGIDMLEHDARMLPSHMEHG